jgi:hypothetical protein
LALLLRLGFLLAPVLPAHDGETMKSTGQSSTRTDVSCP